MFLIVIHLPLHHQSTNMLKEEEVKASIVVTARNLIQQYGIHKLTMQDIAKSAGKGKSTLYYYFKSKEEILDAVIYDDLKQIQLQVSQAVAQQQDFKSKLEAYIHSKIDVLKEKRNTYKFLIDNDLHYFDFNNYFKKMRFLYDEKEIILIKSILESAGASKEVDLDKVQGQRGALLADIILTAIRGLEMEVYVMEADKDLKKKADLMVSLMMDGLR